MRIEKAGMDGIDLRFLMPDGRTLIVPDIRLALAVHDNQLAGMTLDLCVAYEVFEMMEHAGMFNLTAARRGKAFEGFDELWDVELEVVLSADQVERLAMQGAHDADVMLGIFMGLADEDNHDDALLDGSSWYAVNVKQDRGFGVKSGFTTRWGHAKRLGKHGWQWKTAGVQ